MSVIQGIQNIVRFTGVSQVGGSAASQNSYATLTPEAHSDFLRARTELLNLYRAIEKLAEISNINTRFKLDLPDARSTSPLGLTNLLYPLRPGLARRFHFAHNDWR
jgi:hypothetical protein